jgi:hypothetical protein
VQIPELPFLLVGFVVDFCSEARFAKPCGNLIGGDTFIERGDGNELFHKVFGRNSDLLALTSV